MMIWIIVKVALRSLWANRMRSVLAMLGIIIGVTAVIFVLALVAAAKANMMGRISAMGTNLLVVSPGQRGTGGVMSGQQQNLTLDDAEALIKKVSQIRDLAPVVRGSVQAKHLGKNARTSLMGTSVTYFPIRNFEIEKGRLFNDAECDAMSRVAVIGSTTAENLFGQEAACNEFIKLNGINFRVIGVLKSKGDQGWFNPDDQVLIPYSVAMKQVVGIDYLNEIDIRANSETELATIQDLATKLLRKRHHLQDDLDNDFNIRNQAEILQMADNMNHILALLAGGIASISLLVGGIGIMNIMLVTVTERTRENGVRKAIGAKDRDILRQFLIEAVIMSASGGVIGVLAGLVLAAILSMATTLQATVTSFSIALGLGFSMSVGIFFGYYPARRAAKLNPIDALRYE